MLHPYYLKEYRNRWYAIGWCADVKAIRTFGLDRIKALEPQYSEDYFQSKFNPKEYYKNAMGISVMQDIEPSKIRLHISPAQAPYVLSRPIHHSQKVLKESKDGLEISLFLIINYELLSTLLGMGSDLQVIEPDKLQTALRDHHRKAASL